LPAFNNISGKNLSFDIKPTIAFIELGLLVGIIAGIYPAIYLSGFKPINILKGKFKSSFADVFSRKSLIVFQFTLSSLLIVAVLVVYQQIHFIQSTDPGYNKDNVIRFNSEGRIRNAKMHLLQSLKKFPVL